MCCQFRSPVVGGHLKIFKVWRRFWQPHTRTSSRELPSQLMEVFRLWAAQQVTQQMAKLLSGTSQRDVLKTQNPLAIEAPLKCPFLRVRKIAGEWTYGDTTVFGLKSQ